MPKSLHLSKFANNLRSKAYKRYKRKIRLCTDSNEDVIDPYALLDEDFDDSNLPKVHILDINDYLVCATDFLTKKQLKDYKSQKAYKYFTNGSVSQPQIKVLTDEAVIVLTKVADSKSLRGKQCKNVYSPWLCMRPTGEVVVSHCDCTADLRGACSHIAALLFYLAAPAAVLPPEQEAVPSDVELRPLAETDIVTSRSKKLCKDIDNESELPLVAGKPRLKPIGPSRAYLRDRVLRRLAEKDSKATILSVTRPYYKKLITKEDSDGPESESSILS